MKASDLFKELEQELIDSKKETGLEFCSITRTYEMERTGFKIDVKVYEEGSE